MKKYIPIITLIAIIILAILIVGIITGMIEQIRVGANFFVAVILIIFAIAIRLLRNCFKNRK